MGGGKGGGGEMEVTEYFMSLHYGICTSVDNLLAIYVGEKEAWSGDVSAEEDIEIDKRELFGGSKKEGGVNGRAYFLPGGPTQVMPAVLATKLGRTTETCPGFRGVASLFFYGGITSGSFWFVPLSMIGSGSRTGFLWGSNNPYLRTIWMRVRRVPKGEALPERLRYIASTGASISRNGFQVTVNGVTATLTIGSAELVNGHEILLETDGIEVDGTLITIDPVAETITIGSVEYEMDSFGAVGTSTLNVQASSATQCTVSTAGGLDGNPAAIIYECLTNTEWGMGGPASGVNIESFIASAETLLGERFGMSLQWTRQMLIEEFVSEVLDHILAVLFVNPSDGLWTLKLLRGDYEIGDLPVLDATNCRITSFDRKAWGETVNEIVVTWTNPENEQEETISAQDLSNITIQGAVVSDSRNYYGIRNPELAMFCAKRDLASASAPLAAFDLEIDRSAWDFIPGGCAVLNYPEHGISGLVIRLGKIDYGKPGAPAIKTTAVEDIFALPIAAYTVPDSSQWTDPSAGPSPMAYSRVMTAPLYFSLANISPGDIDSFDYPDVMAAILASQDNHDTSTYELLGQSLLTTGTEVATFLGTKNVLAYTLLPDEMQAAAQSTIAAFDEIFGINGPVVGGFLFIGNAAERFHEIAMIEAVDEEAGWIIRRGVLDTVPRTWPEGTPIWFVERTINFLDTSTVRAATEEVKYKLLPRTSLGLLDEASAPIIGTILSERPHMPFRPANVTIGGVEFGAVDLSGSSPTEVAVTWSNRNRLFEDLQPLAWGAATVTPETGQTSIVRLLDTVDGSLIAEHTGLSGTSFNLPVASFGANEIADVTVLSERDGIESLQGVIVRVRVAGAGGATPPPPPPDDDYDPGETFPPIPPYREPQFPDTGQEN